MTEELRGYVSRHPALLCADIRHRTEQPGFGLPPASMWVRTVLGEIVSRWSRLRLSSAVDSSRRHPSFFAGSSTRLRCVPADFASHSSVCLEPSGPRRSPSQRELTRNMSAGSKVHLVRRLTMESRMREVGIVLLNVERDEFLECRYGVELVQVEPLVLERSPPGLDHGIRERDFGLCQHAAKEARVDEVIELGVDVLDSGIERTVGDVEAGVTPRAASTRIATVFAGSKRSETRQESTLREKLSSTA